MTLLEQLKLDQTTITAILKVHSEEKVSNDDKNVSTDMLYQVYIDTLEDSLKTLHSLIEYLNRP